MPEVQKGFRLPGQFKDRGGHAPAPQLFWKDSSPRPPRPGASPCCRVQRPRQPSPFTNGRAKHVPTRHMAPRVHFLLLAQEKMDEKRRAPRTPGFYLFGGGPYVGSSTAHRTPQRGFPPAKKSKTIPAHGVNIKI